MNPLKKRGLRPLSESTYILFKQLLKGTFNIPVKNRTIQQRNDVVHFWRAKNNLTLNVEDDKEILYYNGKKVLTRPDFQNEVLKEAKKSLGAGARSVHFKLKSKISGGSEFQVRNILNRSIAHSYAHAKFTNKAPVQSMVTTKVFERFQIDLIDMRKEAVVRDGTKYSYILSAMDCFSRFTFLRPLAKKIPSGVVKCLQEIFLEHGYPAIVQCDNGSEFKGDVPPFLAKHDVKLINSSPYHPQSQGKVERNNANVKRKLTYCMRKARGTNWVACLSQIENAINNQPKEVLGYQTPFSVYYGRGLSSADTIRNKAAKSTKRCGNRMTFYKSGLSCSIYQPGNKVLLKYPCDKRVPKKRSIIVAKIERRNKAYTKYLVSYRDPKGTKQLTWVSVENITSLTLEEEKARRQKARLIFSDKRRKQEHRRKYLILVSDNDTPVDQNGNLTETIITSKSINRNIEDKAKESEKQFIPGVEIIFNPTKYGNCQFDALSHQLNCIGIHRTGDQLRTCAVNHLSQNRDIYIDFFRNEQYFERYLNHMLRRTTYGDHFTLQAITREFYIQVLVISKLGTRNHRVVSDTGVFDPDLPVLTVGHYPEGLGEHYVSVVCKGLRHFLPNPENRMFSKDTDRCPEDSDMHGNTKSNTLSPHHSADLNLPDVPPSPATSNEFHPSRSPTPEKRLSEGLEDSARKGILNQEDRCPEDLDVHGNTESNTLSPHHSADLNLPDVPLSPTVSNGFHPSTSPTPEKRLSDGLEEPARKGILNQEEPSFEEPLLPNLVLEQIIRYCIAMYPESLFRLQYVNRFFRFVVGRIGYPRVHINSIIMPTVPIPVCVRRIARQFGAHSGLMNRIRQIIQDRRILNTWLVLVESDINWYEIRNVFWRGRR